jgi:hypothetical protein
LDILGDKIKIMKPLRYKEYKTQNAIWIQQEDKKRTNWGANTEQFSLECYCQYLKICEANKEYIEKCYITIYKIGSGGKFDNGVRIDRICNNLSLYLDLCYNRLI